MATTTTRLGLEKPDYADAADIAVLNQNFDDIDAAAGVQVVTSTTRPATPWNGQIIFETDTNSTLVWNSTGSTWRQLGNSATACTSSTRPASPLNGQLIYETDTRKFLVYATSAWQDVSLVNSENIVLNGAFDIWQRGTSFTSPAVGAYSADRWSPNVPTNSVVSRQTAGLTGFRYCMRVQRPSGQTSTSNHYASQSQEIAVGTPFAGKTVTMSFYARAGSNFSAASGALTAVLLTGTGATEINRMTALYTGEATPLSTTATLTTSWQRFTVTGTLGSSITAFTTMFYFTPTGTASTNDYFEITGVQVEVGSVATAFRRNQTSIEGELASCQRYYFRRVTESAYGIIGNGFVANTTNAYIHLQFPVTMRTAPSGTIDWSGTAANYAIFNGAGVVTAVSATIVSDGTRLNANGGFLTCTVASGLTAGQGIMLIGNNNSSAYIGFSAEL